jgi:hypothetical protein
MEEAIMKCLFSTPHQTAADPRTVENLRQLELANLQRKLEPEVRAAVANSLTAQLEPVVRMFLKEKLEADVRQELRHELAEQQRHAAPAVVEARAADEVLQEAPAAAVKASGWFSSWF